MLVPGFVLWQLYCTNREVTLGFSLSKTFGYGRNLAFYWRVYIDIVVSVVSVVSKDNERFAAK